MYKGRQACSTGNRRRSQIILRDAHLLTFKNGYPTNKVTTITLSINILQLADEATTRPQSLVRLFASLMIPHGTVKRDQSFLAFYPQNLPAFLASLSAFLSLQVLQPFANKRIDGLGRRR